MLFYSRFSCSVQRFRLVPVSFVRVWRFSTRRRLRTSTLRRRALFVVLLKCVSPVLLPDNVGYVKANSMYLFIF